MTTKFEDDTTGEQYTQSELNQESTIPSNQDGLRQAGVIIHGTLYDDLDFHPEHADYEALREQLHEMVDSAVDAWDPESNDG